jgi:DNA anti-recombination protein RmuC
MAVLGEQLQLMYERMAIDKGSLATSILEVAERSEDRTRALGEYLDLVNERVDLAARDAVTQMSRTLEMRLMSMAKLVRSDAEALRAALVRTAEDQDERLAGALDERLARVADGVDVATSRMVEELAARFEAIGRAVSDRAAQAADVAIAERFDDVVARLQEAAASLERSGRDIQSGRDLAQESLSQTVDQRISGLARLIRADNETLAHQIVADQEASKQALRAMKELQANLPSEVIGMVEQRFASLAESIERSNEMLAKRIDHMAERIGEQHDTDIQVVIDRMGDAMHALASLGRPRSAPDPGPMLDLG